MQLLREGHSFSGRERNCAYLNCGPTTRFANVSAVTGLDFQDDGRVIAMVDWDHDGDLDAWLHNRTGPRLRLMQNQTNQKLTNRDGTSANFLALRLQGTQVNRDAIGARVEVLFEDPDAPPLIRTLYAGDAFLSQSSKWLHFGLGANGSSRIRGVRVRWPGGDLEEFSDVHPGGRYRLVEGAGNAKRFDKIRDVTLTTSEQQPPPAGSATRVPLFNRPPLPILDVRPLDGESTKKLEFSSRPTLLVLWASWCSTCQRELHELSRRENEFEVIAVAVDEVATSGPKGAKLAAMVNQLQLRFPVVSATSEALDKLELIGRVVLNRQTPLAVPTSFLVDGEGRLAAVYRGAVAMSQLDKDVATLQLTPLARRDAAVPMPGKWTTPPGTLLLRPIAKIFREQGYTADYSRFLGIEMNSLEARRAAASTDEQRARLDQQWASDNFNIAFAHEQERAYTEAVEYYRQGLAVIPTESRAWLRLAHCFQALGKLDDAIVELRRGTSQASASADIRVELAKLLRSRQDFLGAERQLRAAIDADPKSATAHFHLGTLFIAQQNEAAAEQAFLKALTVDPNHFESLLNLGALLAARGQSTDALQYLRRAMQLRPTDFKAKLNLARALQTNGDSSAAQRILNEAVTLEPENAQAHLGLAQIALAADQSVAAKEHLMAAVRINSNDKASSLRLAWLLATSGNEAVRDPGRAVTLATQLNIDAQGKHPIILDTLAAAHAANQNFEAAQRAALKAVEILEDSNQIKLANEVKSRLELYKRGEAFVQTRD